MTCALLAVALGLAFIFTVCAIVQTRRLKAQAEFIEELLKKDRP